MLGAISLCLIGAAHALSPEDKCEAAKNKISGKYVFCRAKANAKAIKKGEVADFSKCDANLASAWAKAGQKAVDKGTSCIDSVSVAGLQSFLSGGVSTIANVLDGNGGLALLPATGETTSHGAGSDGALQIGRVREFVDNGDGTLSDLGTGLMWEKKDDGPGVHGQAQSYTWSAAGTDFDGTVVTDFLDALNDVAGGGASCFAGHCDWRLPTPIELMTVTEYEYGPVPPPWVLEEFHRTATCTDCTDITLPSCSCTAAFTPYWTSTTNLDSDDEAISYFARAFMGPSPKSSLFAARAVRGGS